MEEEEVGGGVVSCTHTLHACTLACLPALLIDLF